MVIPNTDFELLLANDILLWPIHVILSVMTTRVNEDKAALSLHLLSDFARFNDPLEFLNH
jgi:hypothetical protein